MDRVAWPFRVLGRVRMRGDLGHYLALQKLRAAQEMNGQAWRWSFALLNIGLIGMVGALLVAGIAQAFFERAIGGSTLYAFIAAQSNEWFVQGITMRLVFGLVFAAGYAMLMYDLLSIGKRSLSGETLRARATGSAA